MVCTNLGIKSNKSKYFRWQMFKIKVYSNQRNKNLNKQEN